MRTVKSRWLLAIAHLLIMAGCGGGKPRAQAVGEGFVAPMSLNLRQELSVRAAVVATVKHGDRLEILERRRRFVKVRTEKDEEGWTDSRQLLSPMGMARLRRAAERAAKLPSQGRVTPFDKLNVHIEANRQAPSFYQLPEDEGADLIGRIVTPRLPYVPESDEKEVKGPVAPPPAEVLKDDWTLVRLKDGRSGWVLSRMLMLSLPDEVTQYAEGHRITSFFSLGQVEDQGQTRHHWLWTTIAIPPETYQFDGVRVFVWNTRRHRYETAFRESRLRGYYPTRVERTPQGSRFVIHAASRDGILTQREYEFNGHQVKLLSKVPFTLPAPTQGEQDLMPALPAPSTVEVSRWEAVKHWFREKMPSR
ncbi:MAG: SH3 domain-containing protein [Bryobacterales bacterium]|nr:SH3 domain-containing protein [Bryobacterales bacterium]